MPIRTATAPAIVILRVAVAVLLGLHGAARLAPGATAGFGEFLASRGFPMAAVLAWSVTLFELAGAVALAAGRWVVPVSLGFAAVLVGGIVLVHAPHGWWVVGAGRNGVEYSVLLLAVLSALIVDARQRASA
jgi:putative oxidoreductase